LEFRCQSPLFISLCNTWVGAEESVSKPGTILGVGIGLDERPSKEKGDVPLVHLLLCMLQRWGQHNQVRIFIC
jgi:hypothetical protein